MHRDIFQRQAFSVVVQKCTKQGQYRNEKKNAARNERNHPLAYCASVLQIALFTDMTRNHSGFVMITIIIIICCYTHAASYATAVIHMTHDAPTIDKIFNSTQKELLSTKLKKNCKLFFYIFFIHIHFPLVQQNLYGGKHCIKYETHISLLNCIIASNVNEFQSWNFLWSNMTTLKGLLRRWQNGGFSLLQLSLCNQYRTASDDARD